MSSSRNGQECTLTINQWRHTPRGVLPCQSSNTSSSHHPMQVPMQVPFPYQVTPNRKHWLAPARNFVDALLASSTPGYPFQKQPMKQDQLLDNVSYAHKFRVDVGRLCWRPEVLRLRLLVQCFKSHHQNLQQINKDYYIVSKNEISNLGVANRWFTTLPSTARAALLCGHTWPG